LVYNMVVTNFNHGHLTTRQSWFRSLLKLKISHTLEWSFMKDCPYEVLDHAITHANQARNEVVCRNNEIKYKKHRLHFQRKKDNQQTITIRSQYCHKNPLLFPLHHEHRRKNHKWPNLEGKVLMDS
ncbi:16823_t:CDS:2, partial [Funneliformis mosseae]